MCQYIRQLAQIDSRHYVGQCEHGTVSVTWKHCTWHLSAQEFLELCSLAEAGEGKSGPFALHSMDEKTLLWCGESCLMLTEQALSEYRKLLQAAKPHAETDPALAYRRALGVRVEKQFAGLLN